MTRAVRPAVGQYHPGTAAARRTAVTVRRLRRRAKYAMLGAISLDGIWSHAKFDDGRKEIGNSRLLQQRASSVRHHVSLAGYQPRPQRNYNSLSECDQPGRRFYDNYGKLIVSKPGQPAN